MGASESTLPYRVNLIYGGRLALVVKGSGDCPVSAVWAQHVLCDKELRNSGMCRWRVQRRDEDDSEQSIPPQGLDHPEHAPQQGIGSSSSSQGSKEWVVRIRSDPHPQRSLRAGDTVIVEDVWNAIHDHYWKLDFDEMSGTSGDMVTPPFTIKSMSEGSFGGMYLSIDDLTKQVGLSHSLPSGRWAFYDSAGSTISVKAVFTEAAERDRVQSTDTMTAISTGVPQDEKRSSTFSALDAPVGAGLGVGVERLEVLKGSEEEALRAVPETGLGQTAKSRRRAFSSFAAMSNGVCLGKEEEVLPAREGVTLHGVFAALYGRGSTFRQQLADGDNPSVSETAAVEGAPWCCRAQATQVIPAGIMGKCPWEEELRMALCHCNGKTRLLVHGSASLQLPMKSFVTEQLHVFTQKETGGPVTLWSVGKAQSGLGSQKAIEGMREKRVEFLRIAQEHLRAAPLSLLQSKDRPQPQPQALASTEPQAAAGSSHPSAKGRDDEEQQSPPSTTNLKSSTSVASSCCSGLLRCLPPTRLLFKALHAEPREALVVSV
eukprot:CAMPEP_0178391780 /NCGR_PEP_ID=MMETSP0689_2-20121128/11340_1 /TAXON_ID=160604 /ORGANISM="Amphidinium massartii, Strain CS-259" /LENGTH=543 /DNA_ID=CAMNT_0020012335 /DNA_START=69 /DNA_END=1700 /DNA_ORIENTATION=-